MGLFEHYKFEYMLNQIEHIPYQGRQYEAALYQPDPDDPRIVRLVLNRPEKRNPLNDAMFADLLAGLHQAADNPQVHVVVIKGAGMSFCCGHDLSSPPGEETPPIPPDLHPTVRDYFNVERRRCQKYEDLRDYPKPLIAQVHGYCLGAGEFIQAACDFTIAADDAQFGTRGFGRFTHGVTRWTGTWPGLSERFRGGEILTELSGEKAAELGLINKAVPEEELEAEVTRWANALADLPPTALLLTKNWLNGLLDIGGQGMGQRSHYEGHIALQWPKFRPEETNFYRERRNRGLRGFIEQRAINATPTSSLTG